MGTCLDHPMHFWITLGSFRISQEKLAAKWCQIFWNTLVTKFTCHQTMKITYAFTWNNNCGRGEWWVGGCLLLIYKLQPKIILTAV